VTLYSAANDFRGASPTSCATLRRRGGDVRRRQRAASTLQKLAAPAYALGVALLVGVEVAGVTVKGATRWLDIGVTRIQPSEVMRLALPLMLAWYFHKREGSRRPLDFLVAAILMALPVALIAKQPDLGTALLVLAAGVYVIFSRPAVEVAAALGVAGLAMLPLAWTMMHDYSARAC